MKVRKEVKIGITMLVSIALLFWGFNFLKGSNFFKKNKIFYAKYDRVDGLNVSNPVVLNGFKVGQVEKIVFIPNSGGKLLVTFTIDHDNFFLPEDSRAKIISADLLGSKNIALFLGKSDLPAKHHDTLSSSIEASLSDEVNKQILPLKNKAEDLLKTVDSAIVVVASIFNKSARNDLNSSFHSISKSLELVEDIALRVDSLVIDQSSNIDGILTSMSSIAKNFEQNNDQLTSVIHNMDKITDSLAKVNIKEVVDNAAKAMEDVAEITEKVNNGEGSLGALLNNDTLYYNIEAAAKDLDKLLLDMRLNPERYVHFSIFGRKKKDGTMDPKAANPKQ